MREPCAIRVRLPVFGGCVLLFGALCAAQTASRPVAISAKVTVANSGEGRLLSHEEASVKAKAVLHPPAMDEIKDAAQRTKARENWSAAAQVFVDYIPELPKTLLTRDGLEWYIESAKEMLSTQSDWSAVEGSEQVERVRRGLHQYAAMIGDRFVPPEQRERRARNYLAFLRQAARLLSDVVRERGILPPEKQDEVLAFISQKYDTWERDARFCTNSVFSANLMSAFDANPFDERKICTYYESALPAGPLFFVLIRAEAGSLVLGAQAAVVDATRFGEPSAAERAKKARESLEKFRPPPSSNTVAATQAAATQPAR